MGLRPISFFVFGFSFFAKEKRHSGHGAQYTPWCAMRTPHFDMPPALNFEL
jgi:hypothetical protein